MIEKTSSRVRGTTSNVSGNRFRRIPRATSGFPARSVQRERLPRRTRRGDPVARQHQRLHPTALRGRRRLARKTVRKQPAGGRQPGLHQAGRLSGSRRLLFGRAARAAATRREQSGEPRPAQRPVPGCASSAASARGRGILSNVPPPASQDPRAESARRQLDRERARSRSAGRGSGSPRRARASRAARLRDELERRDAPRGRRGRRGRACRRPARTSGRPRRGRGSRAGTPRRRGTRATRAPRARGRGGRCRSS